MEPIIPPTFLFRFAIPCLPIASLDDLEQRLSDDRYLVPLLGRLNETSGAERSSEERSSQEPSSGPFAELRAGWAPDGLGFALRVRGKSKPVWCREGRVEASDGLHVWLATRDTAQIARANQFCHQFAFLPAGAGTLRDKPVATQVWINQARSHPRPVSPGSLSVRSSIEPSGYRLSAALRFDALTGFEAAEQRELGFFYEVVDTEKGRQSLSLPVDYFRYAEDPSLWARLRLEPPSAT